MNLEVDLGPVWCAARATVPGSSDEMCDDDGGGDGDGDLMCALVRREPDLDKLHRIVEELEMPTLLESLRFGGILSANSAAPFLHQATHLPARS